MAANKSKLTTGQVARRVGVDSSTIRRYERQGRIPKAERVGPLKQRLYPASAVAKAREIHNNNRKR